MNSESDYSNPNFVHSNSSVHLPLTLLAGGLAIVTSALAFALNSQKAALQESKAQLLNIYSTREAGIKRLADSYSTREALLKRVAETYSEGELGLKQLADGYSKRAALVKQADDLKKKLNTLIMDLLILGETDDDAKKVIGKYNIQKNLPDANGATASPKQSAFDPL